MRIIFASKRGTLMEQGVSPILISSMVLHTLAGTKYMMVQFGSKNERELFQATQKLFAFLITLVQALLCVFSGMYGPVEYLGIVNGTLIVLQLCVAGVLIILLDELLQKGYGLGNGIGLFTATNICGQVVWECISFTSITSPQGNAEFEGAIVFFFHQIIKMRWEGVLDAFVRSYGPNLLNLVNTLIVTVAINWYQNHRNEITLKSNRARDQTAKLPIRLLYTSNISVLMMCAVVQIVFFTSQILQLNFKGSFFVSIFGSWHEADAHSKLRPNGGLAYYLSPPDAVSIWQLDRFIIYSVFVVAICSEFSRFWVNISGQSAKDMSRRLSQQDMSIQNQRNEALTKALWRYIRPASVLGGMFIGGTCVFADMFATMASGTGIVLAVCIVYQYFEQIAQEKERGQDVMGFI